jgi:hypothetical protein
MAVVAEAISVIVRVDVIEDAIPGGMAGYRAMVPNSSFCTDGRLVRVGFTAPPDVGAFYEHLRQFGLRLDDDERFLDIAIVDQYEGPTFPCPWLRFERHAEGYSSVRLVDEPLSQPVAAPEGWTPENSAKLKFTPTEEASEHFIGMGSENGAEMVLDTRTGQFTYVARAAVSEELTASPSPHAVPLIVRYDTFNICWVDRVEAWPRLSRLLEPGANAYLPFFSAPTTAEDSDADVPRIALTLASLALGILVSGQPPSACTTALSDVQATAALHFVAGVLGTNADEFASAAGLFLSEEHDEVSAIRAVRRACALLPDAVLSRGDLVVRLVALTLVHEAYAMELLHQAAEAFLRIAPGSTEYCKNEPDVLMRGIAALWLSEAKDLAHDALREHRERLAAHPDVICKLGEIGLPQ